MSKIVTSVRVRPFSTKELKEGSSNVISMNENETKIQFKDKCHSFHYDNCFWSHDSFNTNKDGYTEPSNPKYTDQKQLFDKLGKPLVDNAWKGYNCSLFAYGQTGSGKTYSIMGYKENKGLVPMICEDLFNRITKAAPTLKDGEKFQVSMGMLEIYNEKLRDLLNSNNIEKLTLKENPERGFYAPNQLMLNVDSYQSILQKIQSGNKLRTIASTNMNETSSRAHTVVSLQFIQIIIDGKNKSTTKTSFINLVDLAGSEQVKKSQAEGARMLEAQNINMSLLTLGLCLNNLSTKQSHVPYRDSVLTKLLMNALGGNSITVLLAAISPSNGNFEESLSTLRFAERAKKVITRAKINVSETDKVIKNLKEENLQLQQMIKDLKEKKSTKETAKDDSNLLAELQNQMLRNKSEVEAMTLTYKEQLQQAKDELEKQKKIEDERKEKLKTMPHMYNLNEDPALNKVLHYVFDKPITVIGNSKAQQDSPTKANIDIDLQGINIMGNHAQIRHDYSTKKSFILPIGNAKVFINGTILSKEQELKHFDRILLGNSLYFFHYDPLVNVDEAKNLTEPTIEDARQEVTDKIDEFKGLDNKRLLEELSTVYPLVEEANVMAKEMKKRVIYSLVIFHKNLPGYNDSAEPQVRVRVLLTTKKFEYFLELDEFKDIRFGMLDVYHDYLDGIASDLGPASFDPFIPKETDLCCLGFSHVLLMNILHLMDSSDKFPIMNYQGKVVGCINYSCFPCDSSWNRSEISEKEIEIGTKLFIKLSIDEILLDKTMFKQIYYRFKFYDQNVRGPMTNVVKDEAKFKFEYKVDGLILDAHILKYLTDDMLVIEIWGCYGDVTTTKTPNEASADSSVSLQSDSPNINNGIVSNNSAIQKFLEDLQKMTEQRQKDGHHNIEISEIMKIVPNSLNEPSNRQGSIACSIQ